MNDRPISGRLLERANQVARYLVLGVTATWTCAMADVNGDTWRLDSVAMAPSGVRFATSLSGTNRSLVRVFEWQDLQPTEVLTGDSTARFELAWLDDDRLLVFVHRALLGGTSALSSIHVLDRRQSDGPIALDLLERSALNFLDTAPGGTVRLVNRLPDQPNHFLLAQSSGNGLGLELMKYSIEDGSRQPVIDGVKPIVGFLSSGDGTVSALRVQAGADEDQILHRPTADHPWRTVLTYPRDRIELLALELQKQGILVRLKRDQTHWDAYRIDLSDGALLGPIVGGTAYNVQGIHASDTNAVLAYYDSAMRPQIVYVDPAYRRLQQGIDLALPGRFNLINSSNFSKRRFLVISDNGSEPADLFALDQGRSSLQQVLGQPQTAELGRQAVVYERIRDPTTNQPLAELLVPSTQYPPALVLNVVDHRIFADAHRSWLSRMLLQMGLAVLVMPIEEGELIGSSADLKQRLTNTLEAVRSELSIDPQLLAKRVCVAGEGLAGVAALQAASVTPDWVACSVLVDVAAATQYTDLASCADCDRHRHRRQLHQLVSAGLRDTMNANPDSVLWVSDSDLPPPAFYGALPRRFGNTGMRVVSYESEQLPNWRRLPTRDPLSSIRQFLRQKLLSTEQ